MDKFEQVADQIRLENLSTDSNFQTYVRNCVPNFFAASVLPALCLSGRDPQVNKHNQFKKLKTLF